MEDLGLDDISKFVCQASNAATNEEGEVIVKEVAIDLFVMGLYFTPIVFELSLQFISVFAIARNNEVRC